MPKTKQNNQKPSKEELDQQLEELTKKAEEEINEPEKEEEEAPESSEVVEEEVETPSSKPTEEVTPEAEPSKELYKEKFSQSSREAQKIHAKNRVINQGIQDAENLPEPTEDEMKAKLGDDWDLLSSREQEMEKEMEMSKRWRAKIKEASDQATKIEKWNDSVDEFIENPQTFIDNPDLEGKQSAFADFAKDADNNSVPFKVLIPAFLHSQSTGRPSNNGKMFEKGSGGPNSKPIPKNDKISLDEADKIRRTDYAKWKELVKNNKIDISI